MRHRIKGRKLGRSSPHRAAMMRNLVSSLFQHKSIKTTVQKAKAATPFAARLITLAKKGSLADRRKAAQLLSDAKVAKMDDKGRPVTADDKPVSAGNPPMTQKVVSILFNELAEKFRDRNGGYTRIIHLPKFRLGDNADMVIFELVLPDEKKTEEKPSKKKKKKKKAAKKEKAQAVKEEKTAETETGPEPEPVEDTPADAEETTPDPAEGEKTPEEKPEKEKEE